MAAPCLHERLSASVQVARISDADPRKLFGYADIQVRCSDCEAWLFWCGNLFGSSPDGPRLSVDRRELRAPMFIPSDSAS